MRWFWHLAALTRFYSLPYTYLAALSVMLGAGALRAASMVQAALVLLCLNVGLAALNDALHVRRDRLAGRETPLAPALLWGLGIGGTLLAVGLAGLASGWALLGLAGSVVAGFAYAKTKHSIGWGSLWRGVTTASLLLGLALIHGWAASMLLLAGAWGIIDVAGNLWGDVRDRDSDARVGLATLAVVAPSMVAWVAGGLFAVGIAGLAWSQPLLWLGIVGYGLVIITPSFWQHRTFLLLKYLLVTGLLLLMGGLPPLAVLLGGGGCGLVAYILYTAIHQRRRERGNHGAVEDQ